MGFKKKLFIFPVLAFLLLCAILPPLLSAKEKPLIFVGNENLAPYSFVSENRPAGFAVDLSKVLSATIHRDIEIRLMPWEKCISEIKSEAADGIIYAPVLAGLNAYMNFSHPVSTVDFAILVEADNSYVNSLESLEGTVVAIYKKSLILKDLRENARIKRVTTNSVTEALQKLQNREVTAVVADKNMALYYIRQDDIKNLKIVGPALKADYSYAIAVKKNREPLLASINTGLSTLSSNGTLEELKRKWFGLYFMSPFPWKMVSMVIGGIMGVLILLMGLLWVTSLNAAVKMKTHQIQNMAHTLVEKDKLAVLGKLAGQIAHELRTPLSIINNSVYLLRKEGSLDKTLFDKRLNTLEDKVKLSSNILESILSYSRVKAEMATNVSMKHCVEEVIKDVQIPDGINVDVSFKDEENLFVFMDFHQLYSVIRNLVLNAAQAMGEAGYITIETFTSNDGKTVNVRVYDTGPGIETDDQGKIFDLFYSTKITGTGLGLPISKSIIETNGGQLYLEGSEKGGTCFILKLPSSRQN